MFCPKCGKDISENAKFCKHCGAKVKRNDIHNIIKEKDSNSQDNDEKINKILIVAIVVALIVLIALGAFIFLSDSSDPILKPTASNQKNVKVLEEEPSSKVSQNTGSKVSSNSFPVSEAPFLAVAVQNSGFNYPVSYKSLSLSKAQCFYFLTKAVVEINAGNTGASININSPAYAPNPYGRDYSEEIYLHQYVDMCSRSSSWVERQGVVPNYVGINTGGVPDVSPSLMIEIASNVLIDYKNTGNLPSSIVI